MKAEIQDAQDEHVKYRQELEQTQNELTRELKLKYVSHYNHYQKASQQYNELDLKCIYSKSMINS